MEILFGGICFLIGALYIDSIVKNAIREVHIAKKDLQATVENEISKLRIYAVGQIKDHINNSVIKLYNEQIVRIDLQQNMIDDIDSKISNLNVDINEKVEKKIMALPFTPINVFHHARWNNK